MISLNFASQALGGSYKLYKPFNGCRSRASLLASLWNNLLVNLADFRSLQSFQRTIRLVDLSKHLIGV